MSDSFSISRNYSKSKADFINSVNKHADCSISGNSEFNSEDLNWKESSVPENEEEKTHYLCPKCFQFPLIDFISKEYIYYSCFCKDREKKLVKIKQLFQKDNEYMIFQIMIWLKDLNAQRIIIQKKRGNLDIIVLNA